MKFAILRLDLSAKISYNKSFIFKPMVLVAVFRAQEEEYLGINFVDKFKNFSRKTGLNSFSVIKIFLQ